MLLPNFISPEEHIIVKRRKAGTADRIEVKCPEMVVRYNKYMGGVDLMDQLKTSFLDSAIFRRHLRKIKFLQYFQLPNLDIPFKRAKNVNDVLFVVKMGLKVEHDNYYDVYDEYLCFTNQRDCFAAHHNL